MKQRQADNHPRQVFVRLSEPGKGVDPVEQASQAIIASGGRVLTGYAPLALIAQLTPDQETRLAHNRAIASIHSGPIPVEDTMPEPLQMAIAVWNERFVPGGKPAAVDRGEGLAWDAPGRLPPDLPPHLRQFLEKKEHENDADNDRD